MSYYNKLDVDKIGIHDYSYLIEHTIKWLEGYLKLSKSRYEGSSGWPEEFPDQKKQHDELEEVISYLKSYDNDDDNYDLIKENVKKAFNWIGENWSTLWC